MDNLVIANFNIRINKNSFIKGNAYEYFSKENGTFDVTTEEGTKQNFVFSEFDIFFTLLKN